MKVLGKVRGGSTREQTSSSPNQESIMSDWEPTQYAKDPMVNAVYNVAAELSALASATRGLLYGLKYSKDNGVSIAEAIELSAKTQAEAVQGLAQAVLDAKSET